MYSMFGHNPSYNESHHRVEGKLINLLNSDFPGYPQSMSFQGGQPMKAVCHLRCDIGAYTKAGYFQTRMGKVITSQEYYLDE